MLDWVLSFVTSPCIYLIVFAATAVDAFFPPVPSGTLVVTLGAFAATGDPDLAGLLTAAATGAFVGDTIAYLLGRHVVRLRRRASTSRTNVTATRIGQALADWGGGMLILARFIPGGRTVAMVTAGSLRYPLRRFWFFTAVAGAAWGTYTTAIGYVGGELFDSAVPGAVGGVLLASGLSLAVTAVWRRRGAAIDGSATNEAHATGMTPGVHLPPVESKPVNGTPTASSTYHEHCRPGSTR